MGAYLLLRPYINKFFARDVPKEGQAQKESGAKVGVNDIRGVREEGREEDGKGKGKAEGGQKAVFVGKKKGNGGETTASGADWGDGARRRQERFAID